MHYSSVQQVRTSAHLKRDTGSLSERVLRVHFEAHERGALLEHFEHEHAEHLERAHVAVAAHCRRELLIVAQLERRRRACGLRRRLLPLFGH